MIPLRDVIPSRTFPLVTVAFILDPDGYSIELVQRHDG